MGVRGIGGWEGDGRRREDRHGHRGLARQHNLNGEFQTMESTHAFNVY